MYPISSTFQKILDSRTGRNRTIVWWGTLALANGTVYGLTTDTLMQGTGQLSTSCDLPCIGGACSTELQAQIVVPVEPRALKDAKIKLYVRLTAPAPLPEDVAWADLEAYNWHDLESVTWDLDSQTVYTDIPMGVFCIANAKRAINSIKIEAYDDMLKFETALPAMDSKARTPFDWLRWLCDVCGVELGMTKAEVHKFPNGARSLVYANVNSQVETCRDLLSQLTAALCCIAIIDRTGRLILIRYGSESAATLTPDDRFSSEYADVQNYYTGAHAQYKAKALQEYYKNCGTLEDDGLIVDLGTNAFLQISNDGNRSAAIQAIIDTFRHIAFTAYDVSIPFNPAYDLLDVLAFTGGHAPDDCHGPITSIVRNIGGAMTIQCATPEELSNSTRETVQAEGASSVDSESGALYAGNDFWIIIGAFPVEETIFGEDTVTTQLTVECTVDKTCMQIAWTGTYTLDEAATVTAKVFVDEEEIYSISDDQTAGNHVLNVTTGYNVNTQGKHTVKVILREDAL